MHYSLTSSRKRGAHRFEICVEPSDRLALFPARHVDPSLPVRGRDGKGEGHITKINATHNRAVRRAGIEPPFTPYALRHTWATRAVEAGVDLVTVAAIMGPARLNILTRYTHTSDVHKEEAINRLYSQSEDAVPAKLLRLSRA